MTPPLQERRVLAVASCLAAPCCAGPIADSGADVIKVAPPEGDVYRRPMRDNTHAVFEELGLASDRIDALFADGVLK